MRISSYQEGRPNWTDLSSSDPEASKAFYSALFGWKWDTAATAFENLRQHSDDLLYNLYLDRIKRFMQSPPRADWDGVFEHLSKYKGQ